MTDEEMRKNFLGRNRIAALKFRQRKKRWLTNLQIKVEIFNTENDALTVIRTVQLLSNMDSTVPSYYRSLGPSIRR
ncbi:activating transcription factor, other eukaryote [Fusarium oxysporum f. sp. conglutinans race 2 54008]|uniref:Activating transcription factor, other eukaryote n=2 Tax=Fusarium oxysporum f. sp. conglutinans TaxID=100902 RepID=X0GWY9_FUSOX|nr:activating transcription factor, other eukaryote [Fusarium oxysporum f. sp. conglutinans race 2 54008]